MKYIYTFTVTETRFVTTKMEKAEGSLANFLFKGSNNNCTDYHPALNLNNKLDYPRSSLFQDGRPDTI
jgi:hypothetical protein